MNQLFEHPHVAKDVLPLLRSWYEEAKRFPIWKKLRLIVVHSTEIYVPLNLKQSPFNVGLPVQLDYFNAEQIGTLASRYGLDWSKDLEVKQLMKMVGGHPALVNIALYHLRGSSLTLSELLEAASSPTGVYHYHLQRHRVRLEEKPELLMSLHSIINEPELMAIDPMTTYQLSSMGLIKSLGGEIVPSCELYRNSFSQQ